MKAIIRTGYGSPDVLQLQELEKPVPRDDEVLIEIHAASANPADYHRMRGGIARFVGWLLRIPEIPGLGTDVAGRVEAIGRNVTQFHPGDEVFGGCTGSFAEYACARENRLALKPANASFEEAAAVPIAAVTALQGLRDTGKIKPGQTVLVNGASGGVGSFAVQIAKSYGTEVTGVCSTRKLEMVRSIGADHIIDYTREDFTRNGKQYDLIFDAVGNHSVFDYRRALSPQGICVLAGFGGMLRLIESMILAPLISKMGNKEIGGMGIARIDQNDLCVLKELIEDRKIIAVIDRRYPLSETAEAIRYLEAGHTQGKVVITMV